MAELEMENEILKKLLTTLVAIHISQENDK
jgi:hypothetical protein